ncbi:MAG: sulfotransferase [Pseudomonadota bacterium]
MNTPPIIFIVGSPRSGTTWVLDLISGHPDTVHATMANLGLPVTGKSKETGIFMKGLSDQEIIDRFSGLAKENPCKTIVEKTPLHVFHISRVRQLFPQSFIICTIRDGRDVVVSMLEARKTFWRHGPTTVIDAARLWAQSSLAGVKAAAEMLKFPGERQSVYLVEYEDLVRDAVAETKKIFTLFRLSECNVEQIVSDFEKGKKIDIPGVFRKGKIGDWKTYMSIEDKKTFKTVAQTTLQSLGYVSDDQW